MDLNNHLFVFFGVISNFVFTDNINREDKAFLDTVTTKITKLEMKF